MLQSSTFLPPCLLLNTKMWYYGVLLVTVFLSLISWLLFMFLDFPMLTKGSQSFSLNFMIILYNQKYFNQSVVFVDTSISLRKLNSVDRNNV